MVIDISVRCTFGLFRYFYLYKYLGALHLNFK